jgi:hypothetical protein
MSVQKNLANFYMPHEESRRSSAILGALNAEVVHDLDGDQSAVVHIFASAALTATYAIQVSPDGINYYNSPGYLFSGVNGTLPIPGQPVYTEASTTAIQRVINVPCGQMRKLRVIFTAWTSGSAVVSINSDTCVGISPFLRDQNSCTLAATITAATGVAATLSLPAVTGLRHYIGNIEIVRSATAALTASATPTVITTTNLPGSLAFTMGSDTGGTGVDKILDANFSGQPLAALLAGTATTVVCPATPGVIWRVNAFYSLGL